MMNKLFMIVLSVCCLLMAACGTDNDETPQGLRIVDTDVDLAAGGGTVEVALQAAGELTAVSGADWCRVIEVTNEKITLLARANYEYVSRATQVTVSDGSNEQKIVVTQAGNIFAP
ncbi:MAG: BACON domain-containing protein, partial [Bacteroides xylanisolvens]